MDNAVISVFSTKLVVLSILIFIVLLALSNDCNVRVVVFQSPCEALSTDMFCHAL